MMHSFKENSTPEMAEKYLGVMHTVWSSADSFMENYYSEKPDEATAGVVNTLKAMIAATQEIKN
jgi:hypothetical protein